MELSQQLFSRIFLIVLDSVGIGAMPDAHRFGDEGAHTLKHIAEEMDGIHLPNMAKMGLGNIQPIPGVPAAGSPTASFGRMQELSVGKDTMTGHWEMMGLHVSTPFRTYTEEGFPDEL